MSLIGVSYRKMGDKYLQKYDWFICKPSKKSLLFPATFNYIDIPQGGWGFVAPPPTLLQKQSVQWSVGGM